MPVNLALSDMKFVILFVLLFFSRIVTGKADYLTRWYGLSESPYSAIKENVDYILVGEVVAKEYLVSQLKDEEEILESSSIKLKVKEWIKGEGTEITFLSGKRHGTNCSCSYMFDVGSTYLVFGTERNGKKLVSCEYISVEGSREYLAAISKIKPNK